MRESDKLDGRLRRKLADAPDQTVSLIVRTAGDPTPYLARLTELGMQVTHQFRFLPGVSVTGPAQVALALLSESWILSIEEDKPIRAA